MIVTGTNGRRRSIHTTDDDIISFRDGYALCTPEERSLIHALLNEHSPDDAAALSIELNESLYRRPLVSMQQFIEDPYYLGDSMGTMYPALKQDVIDLFSAPYREVLLTGSIGSGKCVDGDTELYDPIAGLRVTVKEASLVDGFGVSAWDGSNGAAHAARAAMSGYKPLGWLELESGVRVRMSPDHPVRTPWGYTVAADLRAGDMVASLRRLPSPVKPLDVSDDIVTWVAYMLADGGSTTHSMTFTNADPRIHDEFALVTMALSHGGHEDEDVVKFIRNDGKARTVRPNGMQWLQHRYDLQHPAKHKRVPAKFYGLSDRQLALFLNRIWACDGWLTKSSNDVCEVGISLASEAFIRDLQQLLLRLGIRSHVRPRTMHYTHNGERRSKPAWSLNVTDGEGVIAFLDAVGDVYGKEDICRRLRTFLSDRKRNPNADITPMDCSTMSRLRREIGPISKKSWWPGTPKDQRLGHPTLVRLRETYPLPEWCRWWPDVFWDRVTSYEPGTVMEPVYDVEVPGVANFAPGGLIVHNTFLASAAICRILYELSCMKNPQLTFGMSPGTEMVIMLISKNLVLAREVMKTSIDDKIKLSPYFMQHFTPKFSTDYTLFPNSIRMNIGSYGAERALGANIFSAFLDETNFPPKRSAQQINQTFGKKLTAANFDVVEKVYRSMVRRIKSRFQIAGGDFPGMVIMVSSAATLDSFTERKLRDARHDPTIFVRDHTAWTSKPKDHFCGKWFYVLCSKSSLRSRILDDGEYDEISQEYLQENNAWLIEVPVEYRDDFESNLEDSLRDIAGVSTQAISAFFQRVDAIDACIAKDRKHPFSSEVWMSGSPATFDWNLLCRQIERRLPGGFTETAWAPKESPSSPRWIHIDTSISGDSTGFCCGRIDRWVEVVRRDGDGHAYTDTAPYYVIEVILCIRPPTGDQIYMPDLRRLVYELQAHGFPIHGFSSDSFQYVEMHQQIRRHGIHTELISMDRTIDPYEELKSAIYEKRIEFYDYTPLLQELRSLEYDRVKGKIDHPRHSSKDLGDALAGVVWGLKQQAARLPWAADADTPNKVFAHDHGWVSDMIPAEDVDVDDVRAARSATAAILDIMPPFFIGDD
jgi:intein/homing endonuclease